MPVKQLCPPTPPTSATPVPTTASGCRRGLPWLLAACLAPAVAGLADDRTMSFSSEVVVVPAPGPVAIDGQTDDWDLSAGVWSYNDPTIVDRYSVWTHLMWDAKGIYFLARFHDPSPLKNAASSKDFSSSWRADCYQARVIFDDRTEAEHQMHLNMYYSSTDDRPYMIVKHGGFRAKPPYDATGPDRPDQLERWGETMEAHGGAIAFRAWDDGQGYNLEAFWPWSYCRTSGEALQPGEAFTFGIEAMWGNHDGTRLAHRLADGIKDETVNRIFMFRARDGWGRAVLAPAGKLDISDQQIALQKARLKHFVDYDTYGSVPIDYSLPERRDVTIAIDAPDGRRVRNLFGQFPRDAGTQKDFWDGLDDAGNPLPPGDYTATILHHQPIGLKFFNSAYSSATPPWPTDRGSLLWGSNHGHPTSVATRGEVTVLYFTGTEGGSGIQRIDENGVILWADGQEFIDGTLDDQFAYGLSRSSWQQRTLLARYRLANGQQVPFDDPDKTPSPSLLADGNITNHATLALAHGQLWACFPGRALLRVNPATGAVEQTSDTGPLRALTDRNGKLYGLTDAGAVVRLDEQGKVAATLFVLADLRNPQRLAVDHQEKLFAISDGGTNQVVLVDAGGQLVRRIGRPYEGDQRPAGAFVKTDLIKPMGTGFDAQGRLWVPEGVKSCKRVGLWSTDGQLLEQFWGQADYGAMAGFPIIDDSTRFIAHGIEFQLDPNPDPWNRKTNEEPLIFHPHLANLRGLVYRYQDQDFACALPGYNQGQDVNILRRDANGVFVPCVHIRPVRRPGGKLTPGQAWVDRNGDGQRSDDELTEVDWQVMYWSNGWARPDLALLSCNGLLVKPQGLSPAGVPLYDFSQPETLRPWPDFADRQGAGGTPIIDRAGNLSNGITWRTADGRHGSYPNPYGRHDAPAARRGTLIAPFRTNGVVEDVPGVGSLTALGGDRGEWFLISMDGLFVSSLCQDIKGNVTLDETFIGCESFGGFIWRDGRTGKVLVQLGGPSYRLMEVTGLESCVRQTVALTVSQEQINRGVALALERQQQMPIEPDSLRVARVGRAPDQAPPVAQSLTSPLIPGAVDLRVAEAGNPAVWWRASLAIHGRDLVAAWQVADASPWKNGQGQFTHAFIGGDGVDLKLDVPGRGPIRLLVAPLAGKNTAIYFQEKAETPDNRTTYAVQNNLANATTLDVVKRLDAAKIDTAVGFNSYTVLLRLPLAELGLDQATGQTLRGVLGVIYSDPSGTNRAARLYWHDKQTGLVSDVPSEARLVPGRWGTIMFDK